MKDSKRFTLVSAQKKDYSIKPIPAFRHAPSSADSASESSPEKRSPSNACRTNTSAGSTMSLQPSSSSSHHRAGSGYEKERERERARDRDLPMTPGGSSSDQLVSKPPKKKPSLVKNSSSSVTSNTIEHTSTRSPVSSTPSPKTAPHAGTSKSQWDSMIAAASKPSSVKSKGDLHSSMVKSKGDGKKEPKGSGVTGVSEKRSKQKRKISTNASSTASSPSPQSRHSTASSPPSSTSSGTTVSSIGGLIGLASSNLIERPVTPPKPFSAALSAHFPNKLSPTVLKSGVLVDLKASLDKPCKDGKFGGDDWPPVKRQKTDKNSSSSELDKGKKKRPSR